MRSHKPVRAGVVLAAVLAITGCTATTSSDAAPDAVESAEPTTPAETPTEAPVGTETPAVPEGPAVGTTLTERPEGLPDGLGWFQLDDGTYLVVDSNAPLPQVVVDQVAAEVVPPVSGTDDWNAIMQSASEAQGRIQRGTGKQAVVIFSIIGSKTPGGPMVTLYNLSGAALMKGASVEDKGAAIAAAEAFVAAQADPSLWVIIDGTL